MILWDLSIHETALPIMLFKVHVTQGDLSQCSKCRCSPLHVAFWGCVHTFMDILLFSVHPWVCFAVPLCFWVGWSWSSSPAKAAAAHKLQLQRSLVSCLERDHFCLFGNGIQIKCPITAVLCKHVSGKCSMDQELAVTSGYKEILAGQEGASLVCVSDAGIHRASLWFPSMHTQSYFMLSLQTGNYFQSLVFSSAHSVNFHAHFAGLFMLQPVLSSQVIFFSDWLLMKNKSIYPHQLNYKYRENGAKMSPHGDGFAFFHSLNPGLCKLR